jgi:hypothetical protein
MAKTKGWNLDPSPSCFRMENQRPQCVNLCRPGMMSRCGAGNHLMRQQKCRFKPSSDRDRCMHFIQARDGHCDSLAAQTEPREDPE